jgi:hypothetical protein
MGAIAAAEGIKPRASFGMRRYFVGREPIIDAAFKAAELRGAAAGVPVDQN